MNIHNHTILTKLKIPSHAWDEQVAWVRGYILALEDILGDLDREQEYQPTGGSTSQLDYRAGHELAVIRVKISVNNTLTQARATLAAMEQMEQEAAPTSWKQFSGDLEPEETEDALQPTQARQDQAQATRPGPGSAQQGPGRVAQAGSAGSPEEPGGQGKTETE